MFVYLFKTSIVMFQLLSFLSHAAYTTYRLPLNIYLSSVALSTDLSTLIISSKNPNSPSLLFRNNGMNFQPIGKVFCNCFYDSKSSGSIKISQDGSIVATGFDDGYLRVYQIINDISILLQQLTGSSSNYISRTDCQLSQNGSILLGLFNNYLTIFKRNPQSNLYEPLYQSYSRKLLVMSPDGKYIISGTSSYLNYIEIFDGANYTASTFTDIADIVLMTTIGQLNQDTYSLIVVSTAQFLTPSEYHIKYYQLKAGRATYVQTIFKSYETISDIKVSPNGMHLIVGYYTTFNSQVLRKYSLFGTIYTISSQHWLLPSRGYSISSFVSNDGSLVGSGIPHIDQNNLNVSEIDLFSACNQTDCKTCWLSKCLSCRQGFVLAGGLCKCARSAQLVGSSCEDCQIANCANCLSPQICQVCGGGFELAEGLCICPLGKSVSSVSGLCVDCSFEGCLRCDANNVCSQSADGSSAASSLYNGQTDTQTKDSANSAAGSESDPSFDDQLIFIIALGLSFAGFLFLIIGRCLWQRYNKMSLVLIKNTSKELQNAPIVSKNQLAPEERYKEEIYVMQNEPN